MAKIIPVKIDLNCTLQKVISIDNPKDDFIDIYDILQNKIDDLEDSKKFDLSKCKDIQVTDWEVCEDNCKYTCDNCGKEISKELWESNKGLCKKCLPVIEIPIFNLIDIIEQTTFIDKKEYVEVLKHEFIKNNEVQLLISGRFKYSEYLQIPSYLNQIETILKRIKNSKVISLEINNNNLSYLLTLNVLDVCQKY